MALDFWGLDHSSRASAVVSGDGCQLPMVNFAKVATGFADNLGTGGPKTLGFLLCRNTPQCLIAYLGALRGGHAVCLLDAGLQPELLRDLLESYLPDWVLALDPREFPGYTRAKRAMVVCTGSQRAQLKTRLHRIWLCCYRRQDPRGARSWFDSPSGTYRPMPSPSCRPLGISGKRAGPRVVTYVVLLWVVGLAHPLTRRRYVADDDVRSFVQREYWDFIARHKPTSLAGVPYHYEVMLRMRLLEKELPALRILTQAGGRLALGRRLDALDQFPAGLAVLCYVRSD